MVYGSTHNTYECFKYTISALILSACSELWLVTGLAQLTPEYIRAVANPAN